jgi:hypothetical protein
MAVAGSRICEQLGESFCQVPLPEARAGLHDHTSLASDGQEKYGIFVSRPQEVRSLLKHVTRIGSDSDGVCYSATYSTEFLTWPSDRFTHM